MKNVLIFLPIVTSHQVFNPTVITAGLVAFLAFSLSASAAYLVNDLLDLDADRRHPTKRTRPLACGDLSLKRQRLKRLIAELEVEHPDIKHSMITALGRVVPSHLLDTRLQPVRAVAAATVSARD